MDWLHINTISYDDKTGTFYCARNQIGSVNEYQQIKIKMPGKPEIQWPSSFRKYLLKPSSGTKYLVDNMVHIFLMKKNNKLNVRFDNNIVVTNGDKKNGKFSAPQNIN